MAARAFIAGASGAAIIAIAGSCARAAGVDFDLASIEGSLLMGPSAPRGVVYATGVGMQLAAGGALGLAYAKLLALAPRTTLLAGAFLGLLHATIAGVLLAALPVFLPAMAVAAPGLLMIERGAPAAALFVLAHVAFGMLMSMWALPHRPVASGLGALGRAAMASDAA